MTCLVLVKQHMRAFQVVRCKEHKQVRRQDEEDVEHGVAAHHVGMALLE